MLGEFEMSRNRVRDFWPFWASLLADLGPKRHQGSRLLAALEPFPALESRFRPQGTGLLALLVSGPRVRDFWPPEDQNSRRVRDFWPPGAAASTRVRDFWPSGTGASTRVRDFWPPGDTRKPKTALGYETFSRQQPPGSHQRPPTDQKSHTLGPETTENCLKSRTPETPFG